MATGSTSLTSPSSLESAPPPPHRRSSAPTVRHRGPLQWGAPSAPFRHSELHTSPPCSRLLPRPAWPLACRDFGHPPLPRAMGSTSSISPVGWQPSLKWAGQRWPIGTVFPMIFPIELFKLIQIYFKHSKIKRNFKYF
jgi:hypothetical protein